MNISDDNTNFNVICIHVIMIMYYIVHTHSISELKMNILVRNIWFNRLSFQMHWYLWTNQVNLQPLLFEKEAVINFQTEDSERANIDFLPLLQLLQWGSNMAEYWKPLTKERDDDSHKYTRQLSSVQPFNTISVTFNTSEHNSSPQSSVVSIPGHLSPVHVT